MSKTQSTSGTVHKHVVVNTLREEANTVAVVTKQIQGETVTRYYLAIGNRFAEVMPEKPRATKIKRHTLCKRVEALSPTDDISIKVEQQFDSDTARTIATKIAPLRDEMDDSAPSSSSPDRDGPADLDRLEKHARDTNPDKHLDIASSVAGDSKTHGGGW